MLSDKEIIEGNRLIMESPFASVQHKEWIKRLIKFEGKPDTAFENARYHSDWNWIMPVVDRIGEYGIWNIRPGCVQLENWHIHARAEEKFKFTSMTMDWKTEFDEPIEFVFLVYHICVKFIKWYNTNSLTTKQEEK